MKKRKFTFSDALFVIFIGLLLFPQTRTPIQVALNKVRVAIFSPSVMYGEERTQLQPFKYEVLTLNGKRQSLPVGNGNITFISYWATWCPPCIAELPSIQKLYADYGEEVTFLLLTNEKPGTVQRFLEKKALDLPVFIPQMKTPEALNETSIPTNYVLDRKGKIIIKETGAADWNSKRVRQLLEGLLQE